MDAKDIFQNPDINLFGWQPGPVVFSVTLLAAVLVLTIFLHSLVYYLLVKSRIKNLSEEVIVSIKKLRLPTLAGFILLALTITVNNLRFQPKVTEILNHVSVILIIITVAWTVASIVTIARMLTLRKYDLSKNPYQVRKRQTQFRVLERIGIAVIFVVAIGAILMTFKTIRDIGVSVLASAGVAGIIIGFAAQKTIATFLAGIQIAITQPIRIEDTVLVEGEYGYIEEITLTYVVVRTWDKRRLIVPISYFIDHPFENWTRKSADIFGTVTIRTDYTVKVDDIRQELDAILEDNELWDGENKSVQVTGSTDDALEVRLLVSASDPATVWNLRVEVRERMVAFLQENYPQSLPRSRVMLENNEKDDFFTNNRDDNQPERKTQASPEDGDEGEA